MTECEKLKAAEEATYTLSEIYELFQRRQLHILGHGQYGPYNVSELGLICLVAGLDYQKIDEEREGRIAYRHGFIED